MADGVNITQGTGTTIATDDIGGVQYQRVKLSQGADGSATDVSSAAPLNVTLANTGANATAVKVDGSAVTQPVSGTVAISGTPTVSGTVAVSTINSVAPAFGSGVRGATVQRVTIATDDSVPVTGTFYQATQPVSLASVPSHAVTNAGTFAVQSTNQANSGVDIGDVTINNASGASAVNIQDGGNSITVDGTVGVSGTVATSMATNTPVGNVAHDAADSGAPIKVGAKATNIEPVAVSATGDRTDLFATMQGKLIVQPYSNPENWVSGVISTAMTGTTSTSLIAAQGAGFRTYVTEITVSNSHATVGTDVLIQDGSGGTTLWVIPAAALYGGAVQTFTCPIKTTANTALYAQNVTTGASTKVSATGFKGA